MMQRAAQVAVGAVGIGGTFWLASYDGQVLDQRWARDFFVVKGVVAVIAVVLTFIHMAWAWPLIPSWSQRLRYLALLVAVVVIAGGSLAQFDEAPVYGRNVCGLEIVLLACLAMVASIRQDRRR